jgi:RNA polymerase sigma factor (TIGR02999 family)
MEIGDAASDFSGLMAGFRAGRKESADRLFELLYPELRRLAAVRLRRERNGHSLQPTLLVNELYIELVKRRAIGGEGGANDEERTAFLGLAGFLMARLLVLHSRPLSQRVDKVGDAVLDVVPSITPCAETLQYVEDILERLEAVDPRVRSVVELRVFEGKSHEEIAAQLDCSVRTVGASWSFARRWLADHLR